MASKLAQLATNQFDNPFSNIAVNAADFGGNQDALDNQKKQQTALKLIELQSIIQKNQNEAALKQKQLDLWNSVGKPEVSDKSTAGDVTDIVDSETVGGRDAGVINDGKVAGDADATSTVAIPSNAQSDSSLVNMMKTLQPNISTAGNLILSKPKKVYSGAARHYDEARTFDYAKRLANQSIIQSGKTRKDISPEDYKTLINDNIPKAETYLYGKPLSASEDQTQEDDPLSDDNVNKDEQESADAGDKASQGDQPEQKVNTKNNSVTYTEGQTAINPKTGKRLLFKAGKWQALN